MVTLYLYNSIFIVVQKMCKCVTYKKPFEGKSSTN